MSSRTRNMFLVVCVSLVADLPAIATEITGQIGAVDEKKGVAVIISSDFQPQTGDKFTVFVDVPDVGEAQVAQGEVNALDSGIALGTITGATGKVAVGQKVKIDSPKAAPKKPAAESAIITGQIGAVQGEEITVVSVSKVAPAVGDKVEVFTDDLGAKPTSVGVGKVAAIQRGLIIARIEQVTGTLGFGQRVKISAQ